MSHKRDKAFEEMKKAEMIRNEWLHKLQLLEGEMKKSYQRNSEMGKSISDINFINDNNSFMNLLKDQMVTVSEEIRKAEEIYQDKYQKLLELQKQVKKLELHKESEMTKYKEKLKKLMQKQTDEINSTRLRGKDAKSL